MNPNNVTHPAAIRRRGPDGGFAGIETADSGWDQARAEPTAEAADDADADADALSLHQGVLTTLAAVLERPIVPRRPVFGTMVERGVVSLLAANPGIGKTTFGIHAACAVASGVSWGGFAVEHAGPVVYLNAEDARDEVARRFKAVKMAGGLTDEAEHRIHLVSRSGERLVDKSSGIQTTGLGADLMGVVARLKPALVVIDPMVMIHSLDENSNAEMAALLRYFGDLASFGESGVLVIHHAGKDAKGGISAARGASSIGASVRSMWSMSAAEKDADVQVKCEKSNHHTANEHRLFDRRSVDIGNGDAVGVLTASTAPRRR